MENDSRKDVIQLALYCMEQAEKADDVSDRYYFQRQAELYLRIGELEVGRRFNDLFAVKRMSFHG